MAKQEKHVILANRPDLVLQLERYGLLPSCKPGGKYEGCAKKWAQEKRPPYNTPEAQALAERLPTGWEELTYEEFKGLLAKLQEAIEKRKKEGLKRPSHQGSRQMLRNMAKIAFVGITSVASMIETSGLGILPENDQTDKKRSKQFSFELILHLIIGTDLLKIVFKELAATMHTSRESQEMIAEILKLSAILLALLAAAKNDSGRLKALTHCFRKPISEGVENVERYVSESLEKGELSGEKAEGVALLLQQAKIALKKDEFEGFYRSFEEALKMIEISSEMMMSDLNEIQKFAEKLHAAMTTGVSDEAATISTVSQAM